MYSIEFFDSKLNYIDTRVIEDKEIEFDYITLQSDSVNVKSIQDLKRGCFIYIREIGYQGIVISAQTVKKITTVSFKHLMSLCDMDIKYNYKLYSSYSLENQLKIMLEELYKKDACEIDVNIDVVSATTDTKMNLKSQTQNILSVMIKALKMYGVIVTCNLNLKDKRIDFKIGAQTDTKVIELDSGYVQDYTITIEDTSDYYTSITVYQYEEDDTGTIIENEKTYYYDEYDGSITADPIMRIIPSKHTTQEIAGTEDFETDAYETAYSKLYRGEFNNSIEVILNKNNKTIEPLAWNIGSQITVYLNEVSYKSVYTGYRVNGNKLTLLLGAVRTELTKKLLIEKRG